MHTLQLIPTRAWTWTALQETLDSTRDLTEARYGAIIYLDGAGRIEDFLSPVPSADRRAAPTPHHALAVTFAC